MCSRSRLRVDVVLLTDVDEDRLAAAAARIARESSAKVCTAVGNLGEPSFVVELAARAGALGDLHSLVHSAGLSPSMAGWREILRVDLAAVAQLLDAFLPLVGPGQRGGVPRLGVGPHGRVRSRDGRSCSTIRSPRISKRGIESLAGADPHPGATYRLAKRAVIRLCERAAVAWGERGGRVVSLSPGLIDTEMGRLELVHNPIKTRMAEMTPVGGDRSGPTRCFPAAPKTLRTRSRSSARIRRRSSPDATSASTAVWSVR